MLLRLVVSADTVSCYWTSRWDLELTELHAEYITTPPLPPTPDMMDMDMSPLPHKAPFVAHIEVPSPTPGGDDIMLDSPVPRAASAEPGKLNVAE